MRINIDRLQGSTEAAESYTKSSYKRLSRKLAGHRRLHLAVNFTKKATTVNYISHNDNVLLVAFPRNVDAGRAPTSSRDQRVRMGHDFSIL